MKNAGVINMNEFIERYKLTGGRFDKFMEKGLGFQVGICPALYSLSNQDTMILDIHAASLNSISVF